jgi:hypothetical protein
LDIDKIDPGRAVERFRESYEGQLDPATIDTYVGIFQRAYPSYMEYLEDSHGWQPPVRRRARIRLPEEHVTVQGHGSEDALNEVRQSSFTLPSGQTAQVALPARLSGADADLLLELLSKLVRASVGKGA